MLLYQTDQVGTLSFDKVLQVSNQLFILTEPAKSSVSCNGFHSSDSGGNTGLANNLKQADVSRPPNMRPAAELLAECVDGNHPDLTAILLTKQGHGTISNCFVEILHRSGDSGVLHHGSIHQVLNFADLNFGERSIVREVEPQAVGSHQRTSLLNVGSDKVSQRCM